MKKLIVTFAFLSFILFSHAQKVIENPGFNGTTSPNVKISKIVLSDTATVLDFVVHSRPNSWIFIPKETWIRNSSGGEKLFVKYGEGIEINERHSTGETGINKYSLCFPPLGNEVEKIDYEENQWKIYDIELVPQEHFSIFPEALLGNWFRTDGSNEWVYGFYDDCAVCESEIWKQVLINQKDNIYTILMKAGDKNKKLFVQPDGDKLLIGSEKNNLNPFSREKTVNTDYVGSDDEDFQLPVFKNDSAVYKGYLRGYNPKMGATGMVFVNNIISGEQESNLITVNSDGTFHAAFPMLYPQTVYVRFLGMAEEVFFEPGETTFQCFDLTSDNRNGLNYLFMGESARVNNDLMAMKSIRFFDYQDMTNKILDMSPEEYTEYVQETENRELQALKDYVQNNTVCKKALQIKEMKISFDSWKNILSYNMNRTSAYRQINKVPRDQREIPLEKVELEKEFFGFIDAEEVNNPLALITGGDYYFFINRLKFSDPVRTTGPVSADNIDKIFEGFETRNIIVDPKVRDLMVKLNESETNEEREEIIKGDSAIYYGFLEKHKEVYREISMEIFNEIREKHRREGFSEHFGMEGGLAMDIMKAQDVSQRMESSFEPLADYQIENLRSDIESPFIVDYLLDQSAELEKEIARKEEAFSNKSGFVVNETPDAKGGDLFDTIMKKYEGNLIFVDFWATWCGPCRSGMEKIKPLKEELKDKNIRFVYLTNPSSPKKTWKMMLPDIDGEHYYLTQDDWNKMAARFKVSGIPHYVLVGKDGSVLKDKVYFASSNTELKKMFEENLD